MSTGLPQDGQASADGFQLDRRLDLGTLSATPYLASGFSFREDWGRWTEGRNARISLPHGEPRGQFLVELWIARAFVGQEGFCDLVIQAGWSESKLFTFGAEGTRLAFLVNAEESDHPDVLTLDLIVVRPKAPGVPPDARALGVGLEGLRVTRVA